jgi:hypothetical protein
MFIFLRSDGMVKGYDAIEAGLINAHFIFKKNRNAFGVYSQDKAILQFYNECQCVIRRAVFVG